EGGQVLAEGGLGVGDAGLTAQREGFAADLLQPRVDLAVHAGDEEGGHGVDLRQVAAGGIGQLEPGEVGLHDVLVPLDGEDQRDVDADALTDGRGDRGQARLGGRDL